MYPAGFFSHIRKTLILKKVHCWFYFWKEKNMVVYVEKAVFDDAMCSENPVCRGLQKQIKTFEEGK